MNRFFILTVWVALAILFVSCTAFAQEPCPGVSVKDGDRRTDTNHFAIVRQLSFPDPVKIHALLTSSQLDPAGQSSAQKIELDQYLKYNYSGDPDVVISDDMTTCDDVVLLRKLLNDETYKPYQFTIVNAKRKVGILSRIDLLPIYSPMVDPNDERTKDFRKPWENNMFFFRLEVNRVPIIIEGEYLTTNKDEKNPHAAGYDDIINPSYQFRYMTKFYRAGGIFFADLNDYALTDPLNATKQLEHSTRDLFTSVRIDGSERAEILHEMGDKPAIDKYTKDEIALLRAPVFVTDWLAGAVASTDYSIEITTLKDDKGTEQVYGNVSRDFVEFDATKFHRPFPDWLIVLLVILVMALIGSLLYIMVRRRQEKNLGT